jgi:hypothetical protein
MKKMYLGCYGKDWRMYTITFDWEPVAQKGQHYQVDLSFVNERAYDDTPINVMTGKFDTYMMGIWLAISAIQDLESER